MPEPVAVELMPYSPLWAATAEREAARLKQVMGETLVFVHHIGSTSIPGIRAKPIVDLMPLVTSLAELDRARARIEALGFEWLGEYGIPERRYCKRSDPATGKRLVHLHFFEAKSAQARRHLAFRDFLCLHPDLAKAYEAEKLRCQRLYPGNAHAYTEAKAAWVRSVEQLALRYFS